MHLLHSQVSQGADDVGHVGLALADAHVAVRVLHGVAGRDHVGEDLAGDPVCVALLLCGHQLLLELLNPRRLLHIFHGAQLFGLVLSRNIDLLAAALATGLE